MSSWYFCLLYLLVTVYVAMCESSRLAIERLRVQILPVATVYQRQITMTSLWGRLMSTRESWGVNGHTTRCTIPISVVLWLRLASGWGLRKWRSVPLCGPLRIGIDFTFAPCFSLHMYACAWHVGVIDTSTSMSPECGFQFTARTSFTHTSERSWSLVQGQLNACLPTISRKIESIKCFAKK